MSCYINAPMTRSALIWTAVMEDIFGKLNERIGELLRKLDDDEDAMASFLNQA